MAAGDPTIPGVTRNRDEACAHAIASGVPDASQVADRFHLLLNWGEPLERLWARLRPTPPVGDRSTPLAERPTADPVQPVSPQQARWETIQRLTTQGWSVRAIARHLALTRKTGRRYQQAPTCPVRAAPPRRRRPGLEAWVTRLETLWHAGDHHASTLSRTIESEGYRGSWATVTPGVPQRRGSALPPERPVRARAFATWCLLPWDKLSRQAGRRLTPSWTGPELRQAHRLAHLFRTLLRARRPRALAAWLRAADQSGIPACVRVVAPLHRDRAAVQAATPEPWSPGPVEGFHHKIKRRKRLG